MRPTSRRPHHRLAASLLLALAGLALWPALAAAHGDEGIFTVTVDGEVDGNNVTYEVVLAYENDGDPVDGAAVTAVATPSVEGGTQVMASLDSTGAPGTYRGSLPLTPGVAYQVVISSESPTARIERAVTLDPPSTTEAATTSTPAVVAPEAPTTSADPADEGDATIETDDGSSSAIVIGAVVVVALGLVAAGLAVARKRP